MDIDRDIVLCDLCSPLADHVPVILSELDLAFIELQTERFYRRELIGLEKYFLVKVFILCHRRGRGGQEA